MTIFPSVFLYEDIPLNSHNIILTSNKNNSDFLTSSNSSPYSHSNCLQNVFIAVCFLNQEQIRDHLLHLVMSIKSVHCLPFPVPLLNNWLSEEIRLIVEYLTVWIYLIVFPGLYVMCFSIFYISSNLEVRYRLFYYFFFNALTLYTNHFFLPLGYFLHCNKECSVSCGHHRKHPLPSHRCFIPALSF